MRLRKARLQGFHCPGLGIIAAASQLFRRILRFRFIQNFQILTSVQTANRLSKKDEYRWLIGFAICLTTLSHLSVLCFQLRITLTASLINKAVLRTNQLRFPFVLAQNILHMTNKPICGQVVSSGRTRFWNLNELTGLGSREKKVW